MTVTQSLRSKGSEGQNDAEEPPLDVVALHFESTEVLPGQNITLFSELYWRNPAIKNRMKAQRMELALTAMGPQYGGFDQLIHAQWTDLDTEVGGKLSVRSVEVTYCDQQMQIVQEQLYNCYGRLIEEHILLVAPELTEQIGQ